MHPKPPAVPWTSLNGSAGDHIPSRPRQLEALSMSGSLPPVRDAVPGSPEGGSPVAKRRNVSADTVVSHGTGSPP